MPLVKNRPPNMMKTVKQQKEYVRGLFAKMSDSLWKGPS